MIARPEYPETIKQAIADDPEWYAKSYEEAKKGDTSAARDLLHGFCTAVEQGREIPQPIRDYLYSAFAGYLSTKPEKRARPGPLERALLLVRGPGNPEGNRELSIVGGRIYTALTIAALMQILVKRGTRKRDNYVKLLELRCISSARSIARYEAAYSSLPEWTTRELREHIYLEREATKHELTADEVEMIQKGLRRRVSIAERKRAARNRALSWQ